MTQTINYRCCRCYRRLIIAGVIVSGENVHYKYALDASPMIYNYILLLQVVYLDSLYKYIMHYSIYLGEQRQATACAVARNSHLTSGTYVLFS